MTGETVTNISILISIVSYRFGSVRFDYHILTDFSFDLFSLNGLFVSGSCPLG